MTDKKSDFSKKLSSLESAIVSRVQSRTFYSGWTRNFIPFGKFAIEANIQYALYLLLSVPLMTVVLGLAGLVVGVDVLRSSLVSSSSYVSLALQSPNSWMIFSGLFALGYALSIFKYKPINKQDYGRDGSKMVTENEEWEFLFETISVAMFPLGYFALLYFDFFSPYISLIGVSEFVIAGGISVAFGLLFIIWMRHRYRRYSGKTINPTYDGARSEWFIQFVLVAGYLSQIHFGIDLVAIGSVEMKESASLFGLTLWSLWVARRLRWTVYEDKFGFKFAEPRVRMWNSIARVPLVFAVMSLLLGSGVVFPVVVGVMSPLIATFGYLSWRYVVTFDMKAPPIGMMTSPGRKQYSKLTKENDELAGEIEKLRDSIENLNSFLDSQSDSFTTVPESNMSNFDLDEIEETLKTVHQFESSQLDEEEYEEYMEYYQKVKSALSEYKD